MRACGGSHFQNLTLNFWQFLHSVTIARTPASGEESCSLFLAWVFCSLHQVSPLDSHTAAFQGQPHSGRTTMLSELWQKQLQAARPLTSSLVTQSSAVLHGLCSSVKVVCFCWIPRGPKWWILTTFTFYSCSFCGKDLSTFSFLQSRKSHSSRSNLIH